jgi:hypothetical protein
MHVSKLGVAQKQGEDHDARYDRYLGRLEIDRPQMKPAARSVNFRADEPRQNQEEEARKIHGQRTPAHPAIINQARHHEGDEPDRHPIRLLAPEF